MTSHTPAECNGNDYTNCTRECYEANETSDTGTVKAPFDADTLGQKLNVILNQPITGNGDTMNPLRKIMLEPPRVDPQTITEHAEWLSHRGANLARWARTHDSGENAKAILLETVKRMEGNIRGIRSLLNADDPAPEKGPLHTLESLNEPMTGKQAKRRWFKW